MQYSHNLKLSRWCISGRSLSVIAVCVCGVVSVSLFGWLFDYVPLSVFPILVAVGLLTIFLSSWMVTDPAPAAHQLTLDTGDSFLQRLCQPQMMIFFSV